MIFCNTIGILPRPVRTYLETLPECIAEERQRMLAVVELSRLNAVHRTGGPFGAAVFESATGRLIAAGVNVVVESCCSHAHAEMVALAAAEQRLETFDLGRHNTALELVTSTEPCAMCFGAIIWSKDGTLQTRSARGTHDVPRYRRRHLQSATDHIARHGLTGSFRRT